MHVDLRMILLVLAFVCFVLSAMGITTMRWNLTGAGLAFATLAMLVA